MRSNLDHGDIICDQTDKFLSNLIYSRTPNLFNKSLCQGHPYIHRDHPSVLNGWSTLAAVTGTIKVSSRENHEKSLMFKSTENLQKTSKYLNERKDVLKFLSSFWSYVNIHNAESKLFLLSITYGWVFSFMQNQLVLFTTFINNKISGIIFEAI